MFVSAVKFTSDFRQSLKIYIIRFARGHIDKTKSVMVEQSILVHKFKLKKDDLLFNVLVIIFEADFWIYWNEISWGRFARFIYLLGSRDQVLFQIDFRQSSVNFSDISDPDVFWYCPNL